MYCLQITSLVHQQRFRAIMQHLAANFHAAGQTLCHNLITRLWIKYLIQCAAGVMKAVQAKQYAKDPT